jgi:uroporphyrinogen-III decarboxylase
MASNREERKDDSTISSLSSEKQQQEIREAIVDAFDEAKGNTERALTEAKKEVPRYREAINNHQEKTLEAAKEIADYYIDSQKEIFNLFQQSAWMSILSRNEYGTFWLNWTSSVTKRMTETYAKIVSVYLGSILAATRLMNKMISVNMETFNPSLQQANEFSKISANNVKTIGLTLGEYTKFVNQFGVRGPSVEKQI